MKHILIVACLIFLSPACRQAGAEAQSFRVMETFGRVEAMDPATGRWKPLLKAATVTGGMHVRTGPESWAIFLLSQGFEEAAGLGAESTMGLSTNGNTISVEQGRLYLVMEDGGERPFLRVSTTQGSVKITHGGHLVDVSKGAVEWRVYGEEARVTAGDRDVTVREGHRLLLVRGRPSVRRMNFTEYEPWQIWIRRWYEKKDDAAAERWQKETRA